MARVAYTLALGIVSCIFITGGRVHASEQEATTSPAPEVDPMSVRVGTADPVLIALIRDATDRSATFRRLVAAIAATDGVVYVVRGRCRHGVRACLLFWMGVAGPNRILRVIVDDRKGDSEAAVSIAHELRHAVEVLDHRDVRTGPAMYGLFERIGTWRGDTFETRAAVEAGEDVRAELRKRRPGQAKR